MHRLQTVCVAMASICLWSSIAWADLSIIYDSGATRPLVSFLDVFGAVPPSVEAPRPSEPMPELGAADLSRLLPIRSPGLTPGLVTRRPLRLPNNGTLPRPFFLIGADDRSRTWLARHRDRLAAIGAVGMLVHAASVDDLDAIARLADGLPILPASASDIARVLGIKHFPVLISRRGIEP